MIEQIARRKENSHEGERRRAALVEAMDLKNYEFNTHGIEMGQFYESDAIASDGSTLPEPTRDPDLYYEQSNVTGSPLPHAWVVNHKAQYALLALSPYTRVTLFPGLSGPARADDATTV